MVLCCSFGFVTLANLTSKRFVGFLRLWRGRFVEKNQPRSVATSSRIPLKSKCHEQKVKAWLLADPPGLCSGRRPNSPTAVAVGSNKAWRSSGPAAGGCPAAEPMPVLYGLKRKAPPGSERRRQARNCVCRRQTKHGAPKGVRGHASGGIRLQAGKRFCLLFALKK